MPKDTLELALTKTMSSALFVKSMKTGHGKDQTKYASIGQCVERPAMEAVWGYILKNEPFGGTSTNDDFQSLYQPGLVQKRGQLYIRCSSDGVILVKDCHGKRADPIEVKARVSANTFHRTVNQFNENHGLADMPGLGREACEVKCYQLKDDDEHLRGIVPESHDLFQVLHHAYTYRIDRCYYAVNSHVALLYLILINFRNSLLHAYQSITDRLYDQVYAQFYVPGPEVPAMSPDLVTTLNDDRLSHLKMSNHAFQCYLDLWRAINVNTPEGIYFPLPRLARTIPWLVAAWNTIKGDGNTLTKISGICQE